ncbi:hypothetical protein [Candidatus Vondammii sp. HM_W22]|uniref:hypothetical protein n=1 Tax=Candidatus Vondammii sp. HM_W22 TaxID=2687299 RepID=UPI001F1443BF|nr:hypothetical protein [Candidatus Vondammii sp. HM_W22]
MDKRDEQAAKLAAGAVDDLHDAVLAEVPEGAAAAMARYEAVIWKMNGGTFFGV